MRITRRRWHATRRPCFHCGRVGYNRRADRQWISTEGFFGIDFDPHWFTYLLCPKCWAAMQRNRNERNNNMTKTTTTHTTCPDCTGDEPLPRCEGCLTPLHSPLSCKREPAAKTWDDEGHMACAECSEGAPRAEEGE